MSGAHKSQRPAGTGRQGGKQEQQTNPYFTLHSGRDQSELAMLNATADWTAAVADDRQWFALHPRRSYRLRAVIGGEWGALLPEAKGVWVLVRQSRPGVRKRRPVYLTRELLDDDWIFGASPDVDSVLAVIAERLARNPDEVANLGEALALARLGGSA